MAAEKIQFGKTVIGLRQNEGFEAATDAIRRGPGQSIMDEFQAIIRDMQSEESVSYTHLKVDLFQLFWRELELVGTRLYEPHDFEQAIELASSGTLPLSRLISEVCSLDKVPSALHQLESGGEAMKILVHCSEE